MAEILNRMVPLMRSLGLKVDWKVIRGDEEFFRMTKHVHNSLQRGRGKLTKEQIETYRKWQEVNAFQRASAVVFQKSIREGFGLTVSEALWKERPVLGGNAGGIRVQIIHGVNGFLVETPEEAAYYALYLLKNEDARRRMGVEGREHVRRNFLITHHIRRYLMAVFYLAKRARPAS